MGREKGWHHFLSFPFPSSLALFPVFPLPSLLRTQRGQRLCGGEWYSHLLVRSVLQTLVPMALVHSYCSYFLFHKTDCRKYLVWCRL